MTRSAYSSAITVVAAKYGLDADLLEAQVLVESAGEPFAWNPEPAYRYLWNVRFNCPFRMLAVTELTSETPPADFHALAGDRDQEWWGQQASWGLMQIMGAVAREHGFRGPYLPALCDVETNLELGTKHLESLLVWAGGDYHRALAAYNGGRAGNVTPPFRNEAYARSVFAVRAHLLKG